MPSKLPCESCDQAFLISLDRCPHCGRPGLFPNVRLAEQPEERESLERRYQEAVAEAEGRDCGEALRAFEEAGRRSEAVTARDILETQRLASSDDEIYSTFHHLIEASIRVPAGEKWDALREVAGVALFGSTYKGEIRFAALSLDGVGLRNYGDMSWVLAEEMIAHRASAFEENSVQFLKHKKIQAADTHELPAGHRATWAERARLCVVKLAGRLEPDTEESDFAGLLMRQGASSEDDDYVEVHVGGMMTVRSLARIVVTKKISKTEFRKLRLKLSTFGVELEAYGWTP